MKLEIELYSYLCEVRLLPFPKDEYRTVEKYLDRHGVLDYIPGQYERVTALLEGYLSRASDTLQEGLLWHRASELSVYVDDEEVAVDAKAVVLERDDQDIESFASHHYRQFSKSSILLAACKCLGNGTGYWIWEDAAEGCFDAARLSVRVAAWDEAVRKKDLLMIRELCYAGVKNDSCKIDGVGSTYWKLAFHPLY